MTSNSRNAPHADERLAAVAHPSAHRVPPQAVEVEKAILGAMLLEHGAIPRAIEVLVPDAFYRPEHERIYQAALGLFEAGSPVDIITLAEELRQREQLDAVGGAPYLAELADGVASAANVEYHARIVSEKALLRKLISTMTQRIAEAYDSGADAFELLDSAESDIFGISESPLRRGASSLKSVLKDTLTHLESIHGQRGGITGVPSGFRKLDDITGGWQNSDLIIIAARPSMGKCLAHDAGILLSDGSVRSIADICATQRAEVLTLGDCARFRVAQPSDFIFDGLKPVFRVTTRLGRQVDTTLTHPFLTPERDWLPLSALRPGDSIAVPRRLPVFGSENRDAHYLESVAQSLTCVPAGRGVGSVESRRASLPEPIHRLCKEDMAQFLRHLLAQAEGGCFLEFANDRAARQIQHLLVRFGILSRVWQDGRLQVVEEDAGASTSARGDVYFDPISSIDALGVKPVYDLTIPATHNFVANDVCVHNTALALNCARNAALNRDRPTGVAIFSLEMSAQQLAQRLLTSEARVDAQEARTGRLTTESWRELARAAGRLNDAPIFVDDTPGLGVLELRAKCRRLKAEHNIGLVLVDYLQLMQAAMGANRQANREQEIAQISRSLKSLAKELDVPVIALSQLSRSVENRGGDKRPQLSDLRESGSIEQDADVVAFIYRAEYYGWLTDDKGQSTEGIAELIIRKQRNGPTDTATLAFVRKYAVFENLLPFRAEALPAAGTVPELAEDSPF